MEHDRPPVAPSPGPKRPRGDSLAPPESTGKMGGLWLEVGRLREEAEQHEHKLQDAVRDATKALKKEAERLKEQLDARDTLIDTLQAGLAASQAEAATATAALAAAATAHTSFAGALILPPPARVLPPGGTQKGCTPPTALSSLTPRPSRSR